jgi:PAS domain S-box-containing protein
VESVCREGACDASTNDQLRWHSLILENVRESIIVTDPAGAITYWNAGATALFGYTAEEMLGRTPAVLYPDGDPAHLRADLAGIGARRPYSGAWLGRRKDGTQLWVDITTTPLYAAGEPIGFIGVAKDITALHNVEQAREGFLAAVVHDLKTPLTSIRGHAQLAARRLARLHLPAGAPVSEHLVQIEAGTQRLARLIDELADVTRLQSGTALDLERRPTDVVGLVRAVAAQHQGLTGHRLEVESTLPALEVVLDAPRVERVLGNLLANAIKYSPAGHDITVRLAPTDDTRGPGVCITVQDRGIGIPAADLPHIFERFHRARNVIGVAEGTGIGLASARMIVEQHGGTIAVESVEGVGTTVSVWLPRRNGQAGGGEGDG